MPSNFVPAADLFLSKVIARDTNPDGTDRGIIRRMDNETCRKCHLQYKEKYPDQPFNIKCIGIYSEIDFIDMQDKYPIENPGETIELDDIREAYDVVYWASKYTVFKDSNGDIQPFIARPYQAEVLGCTANRKVDRMGRGLGKTSIAVIKELHKAITNKKYDIMVVCPAQPQSERWAEEIRFQLANSPYLNDSVAQQRQQPYHLFRFWNGSTISIFTAGSKSGRGADSVRGQSPKRVRLDEQDYLVDKDYQAIMPLVRRYKDSEFHGSSTPTGLRGMFWEMCTRNPEYKEFYFPISFDPNYSEEMKLSCMREAKTMEKYRHEFLAEFGDPESGVFKSLFVDAAKKMLYAGAEDKPYYYQLLAYNPAYYYFMGVDWNGKGTGTKIRVIEYDPVTKKRRVVARQSIDTPGATTMNSMTAIRDLNRIWHCSEIFLDYGFGAAQDEMLRAMGQNSDHPDDKKLARVRVIDFGANMEFNKLVSLRGDSKYIKPEDDKFERKTKPFMVDGMVMALEGNLFEFSGRQNEDEILEEQLRAYRVKTYSQHGYANTYEAGTIGDHDLDALMLAMLACEMQFGLFHTEDTVKRLASILHSGGWGVNNTVITDRSHTVTPMEIKRQRAGVPDRSANPNEKDQWRIAYLMKNGAYVAPIRHANTPQAGSRTSIFRNKPRNKGPFGG